MTNQEAMNNIKLACAGYRGTLQEHTAIQRSIEQVEAALAPKAPEAAPPVTPPVQQAPEVVAP